MRASLLGYPAELPEEVRVLWEAKPPIPVPLPVALGGERAVTYLVGAGRVENVDSSPMLVTSDTRW